MRKFITTQPAQDGGYGWSILFAKRDKNAEFHPPLTALTGTSISASWNDDLRHSFPANPNIFVAFRFQHPVLPNVLRIPVARSPVIEPLAPGEPPHEFLIRSAAACKVPPIPIGSFGQTTQHSAIIVRRRLSDHTMFVKLKNLGRQTTL